MCKNLIVMIGQRTGLGFERSGFEPCVHPASLFCFDSLCCCSRKLKSIFSPFWQFACFYFKLSLANWDISIVLFGWCVQLVLVLALFNRNALYSTDVGMSSDQIEYKAVFIFLPSITKVIMQSVLYTIIAILR